MDEKYCIGIQELDTQHEEIDQVITTLFDALGGEESREPVHSILVRLYELLRFHFAVEESVMEIVSYPFVLEHRSAHRTILQRVDELKDASLKNGDLDGMDKSVRKMLALDIVKHDRVFAEFVRTHCESLMH